LRLIIDSLSTPGASDSDPDAKKLGDLYASFMDEAQLETLGLKPLQAEFASIDAISDKSALPALIAHMNQIGVGAPYGFGIAQDSKDSTHYAVILSQGGLGLPDRDYYLKDDAKLKDAREKYLAHIEKMSAMAGERDAAANAAAILALETSIARAQWTRVEQRDPVKTYNKTAIAELSTLMPGYDWQRYIQSAGIGGKVESVIVRQPSYFGALSTRMEGVFQMARAVRLGAVSIQAIRRRILRLQRRRAARDSAKPAALETRHCAARQ